MRYLSALTTLRFLAAAMIVTYHVEPYFGYGSFLASRLALDQGVSFFFVLSGFILFYRHGEIAGLRPSLQFIMARIARIWPLHAATLSLTLLFVPSPWGPAGLAFGPALANLLLLQSWVPVPGYFFSYNAVAWSLSTELFFYVAYPMLSFQWGRSWPWKLGLCGLLAAGAVSLALLLKLSFYTGTEELSIDSVVYIHPFARIFEFALGMASAQLWRVCHDRLVRVPVPAATILEIGTLLLAYWGLTGLKDDYAAAFSRNEIPAALLKWLVESGSAPIFALVMLVFAIGNGLLSRAMMWRPLVVLGEISFAIYLCHQLLFRAMTASGTLASCGGPLVQFAAYWASLIGLSYALHRLVELPCQRAMLSKLSIRRNTPTALTRG